jgi:hypothetical protein
MKSAQSSKVVKYFAALPRMLKIWPKNGRIVAHEVYQPGGTSADAIRGFPRGAASRLIVLLAATIWLGQNINHCRLPSGLAEGVAYVILCSEYEGKLERRFSYLTAASLPCDRLTSSLSECPPCWAQEENFHLEIRGNVCKLRNVKCEG